MQFKYDQLYLIAKSHEEYYLLTIDIGTVFPQEF